MSTLNKSLAGSPARMVFYWAFACFGALVVALVAVVSKSVADTRRFPTTIEGLIAKQFNLQVDRVILATSPGAVAFGRNVEINDPVVIEGLLGLFAEGRLVDTRDFQGMRSPDIIKPKDMGFHIGIRLFDGSRVISGNLYIGGNKTEGLGFLVERPEDSHWFHGAWDPWPIKAYWLRVLPIEWLEGAPQGSGDQWAYEMFSYLFFLEGREFNGSKLYFAEDGRRYVVPEGIGIEPGNEFAREFVELNSIQEFWEKNPDRNAGITTR